MKTVNIAVFASGSGSNFAAIIDGINSGIISNAEIKLLVSNKKEAFAIKRAENAGIPVLYLPRSNFSSDKEFDLFLLKKLQELEIDIVLLAGYLRILTPPLLEAYKYRILNIHPSLLPEFGGMNMYGIRVHEEVIKSGKTKSGCSVHLVNETVDGGPVLARTEVPVFPEDTPETLAKRVLAEEHNLFPKTVNEFIEKFINI